MSNAVSQLVCPNCAASVTSLSETGPQRCPQCGHPLEEAGVAHPAGAAARPAVSSVPEGALAAEEEALIADLREALGFDAGARRAGEARLTPGSASAQLASPGEPLPGGTRLGDFELLGELGRGGMGVVYRARQVSLGREVALKVLPAYARHGRLAVQRFRAEAQAAGRLHHTNIVAIHAQGEDQGHYFYAMELIDGVGLDTVIHARPDLLSSTRAHSDSSAARLRSGPALRPRPAAPAAPPPDSPPPAWTRDDFRHIARLVAEVADALDYAHRAGVIHRDVKPHNLLLGYDNRLHLTDFGLARLTDAPHLTVSGEVLGTPAYLSPEQIRGDLAGVDERTDIYSLGVTLYEIVTRQKPFDGQTRDQIIASICTAEPLAPRRIDPRIPLDLETICLRAIEKDIRRRHPSAAALADDLRRFAEGRPILSKRVTRAERLVKWVRRHKALTTACAAILAAGVLAGTLLFTTHSARQREAAALLAEAYEQLAFFDYRTPGLEQSHVAPAEQHGADAADVALLRALAGIGAHGWAPGIPQLRQYVECHPDDPRSLYLLAWFEHESSDRVAAAETFARAERVRTEGAALTPDAWFFRGLALHFERPDEAIASYRQAIAQRAAAHGFYPLAALHLARARNQQLYQTRRLEHFSEADTRLGELIEHGYYGTYPYYLRSIAHRLAAEIYSGSTGTRDDSLVNEHYEQALHWARAGQAVDPADDRPVTAEAECLESLGRFTEAIALRTRARELARTDVKRCEQLHYRWRLYFWTGELDAARADVAAHAACLPENWDYAYLFPALVSDELGDHAAARARLVALADDHPRSARAVIWAATGLRLIGEPAAAQELLANQADNVDFAADLLPPQTETWLRALYDFTHGDGLLEELEAHAQQAPTPWKLWGEAHFHAAARALAAGDHAAARTHLQRAYRSFDGEMGCTFFARLLLVRMAENPSWPKGGAVSWTPVPDGWHGRAAGLGVSPAAERKNP